MNPPEAPRPPAHAAGRMSGAWVPALLLFLAACGSDVSSEPPVDSAEARQEAEARVLSFLESIEGWDLAALRLYVTDDFQLIEDTVKLDLPTFRRNLESIQRGGTAIDYTVADFRTEVEGDVAWTSYEVSARVEAGTDVERFRWLESAVLRRIEGDWRIDRMQSGQLQSR